MKGSVWAGAICLMLLAYSSAYSQGGAPSLDAGSVKDSTYTNSYFGMQLRIPEGWQVQDNEATRALLERGKALAAGDDKNLNSMYSASELRSLTLLTVFKHSFEKEIYNQSVGGIVFGVLDTTLTIGTTTIHQKYFSTLLKGYALSFIISFSSDQELQSHNKTIESIRFR